MVAVVNLRQARKRKTRVNKETAAAQNRILHGRTKLDKTRERLAAERSAAFLEAHRREPKAPGDGG